MPKQTAVEWLVNELKKSKHYHQMINEVHRNSTIAIDVIQQAKEMEKEQIERMYSEAIEFAEWIRIKDFQTASKDNWIGLEMRYYTTKELFEQFKKK